MVGVILGIVLLINCYKRRQEIFWQEEQNLKKGYFWVKNAL